MNDVVETEKKSEAGNGFDITKVENIILQQNADNDLVSLSLNIFIY